jgi:hypothetical protein
MRKLLLLLVVLVFVVSACDLAGQAGRGLNVKDERVSCDVDKAVDLVFRMVGDGASDRKIMNALDRMGCEELVMGVRVR